MTIFRSKTALAPLAFLAACSQVGSDPELACDEIPGFLISPQPTADQQYNVVGQCIHKWGFRFALAPGSNSEIAKAVVYRCEDAIAAYNLLRIREKNPISEQERSAFDQELLNMALMRVVQERAGHCPLVPTTK